MTITQKIYPGSTYWRVYTRTENIQQKALLAQEKITLYVEISYCKEKIHLTQ